MENKVTNIKERILQIAEYKGVAKEKFFSEIGMTYGNFKGKSKETPINSNALEDIISNHPEINIKWLVTGNGEMLDSKQKEDISTYSMRTDSVLELQEVPLYEYQASAGLVTLFRDHSGQERVGKISVPNLPKCDGAIYITGDSMYPLLKSGDIIMYKQSNDHLNGIILYGEMYLVGFNLDGDDHVSVKWLHKSDLGPSYIKLVSENKHHEPVDIPRSSITAIALVKASIRMNSMI